MPGLLLVEALSAGVLERDKGAVSPFWVQPTHYRGVGHPLGELDHHPVQSVRLLMPN